jgi:hypothetical protein
VEGGSSKLEGGSWKEEAGFSKGMGEGGRRKLRGQPEIARAGAIRGSKLEGEARRGKEGLKGGNFLKIRNIKI